MSDQENNDDDNDDKGGISGDDHPVLDLPPGVELPSEEPSLIG